MFAVVTAKGQMTLPRKIRDRLGLAPGSLLDFSVNEQGLLLARPVTGTALGLAGLLRRAGRAPVPLQAMEEAVLATAAHFNAAPGAKPAPSKRGPSKRGPSKPTAGVKTRKGSGAA